MGELSPWSPGPLLRPVHGGLATGTGRRAHWRMARGCYGGRELAAEAPRERSDRGEPHRGRRAAAVEARRGWCSSRGGWKMRAGITAGYGVGAHSAFYRAWEVGSGGGRGVTGGGSVELQGATISAMKWGEEWTRHRVSAGKTENVRRRIDSASSEWGGCRRRRVARQRFGQWRVAPLLDSRKEMR
jgi:hypothetical protein